MSVAIPGFKSSPVFEQIQAGITADAAKKVNAVFQFDVKNASGQVQSWTLDLKATQAPFVQASKAAKADIIIAVADDDFVELASGKLNGQKAFMAGKLKVKGNMMLATKLDAVLKQAQASAPAKSAPVAASPAAAAGGGVHVPGFASSALFVELEQGVKASAAEAKKVNAIFQFDIKNTAGKTQTWTLDLKQNAEVYAGQPKAGKKADAIISIGDQDFVDLGSGKLNGQKAFMGGKLKVKGQMMLAAKLDTVIKQLRGAKAKL